MLISEIKKWAKEKGYVVTKEKGESTSYTWYKIDDPTISGVAPSVSKVATAVFNHITDNKWLEYQQNYKEVNDDKGKVSLSNY